MLKPPVSPSAQRTWSPFVVSAVLHLLILAAAAGLSRRSAEPEPSQRLAEANETRRVDMIYVPPPEPAVPAPSVQRLPPPPPPKVPRTRPEPEPNAPPDAKAATGGETDRPDDREEGEPVKPAPEAFRAPAAENAVATMESEARRIFGRPRLATRAGAGPQATRPMEAWFPDNPERCIPREQAQTDSVGSTQLGTAVGRIFRQDNGRPLAGAHLQMIGTPYVAFTDGSGEYRFRFSLALVENCRTQYVKVTAAGYESRLLVLVVGPQVRSEDVRPRRR